MAVKEQKRPKNVKKDKGSNKKKKVQTEYQKERDAFKRKKSGKGSASLVN